MSISQTIRWTPALAAMLAIGAGCADQSPTALAPEALGPSFAAGESGKPELISNSVRYQDSSRPNATGRAGSATVTARALIGKDGKTLVEVTTGGLDGGAAAAGNLDKVQLKGIVDPEQDPIFTRNFNGLKAGGYFSGSFDGLARGTTAQVQVNVSGIDRNRTGVVTLPEMVKMRPDLRAEITAPGQAYLNADVLITGVISEANGDVGATANCVLYVDGAEKDRAAGIWVNNGSQVSCAFQTQFDAVGTYEIKVAAEDVVPGDWDPANNAASADIEIIEPTQPLHGYGHAYDYYQDDVHAYAYSYGTTTYNHGWRHVGRYQGYYAHGSLPSGVTFPVNAQVEEVNGGALVNSAAFSGLNPQQDYWYYHCTYQQGQNAQYVQVCGDDYYGSYASYQFGRHAGFVTYYSINYAEWTGTTLAVYSMNYSGVDQPGQFANWASDDLRPTLTLTDADGESFKAAPVFDLQPYNYSSTGRYDDWYWYGYSGAWSQSRTGRIANASF